MQIGDGSGKSYSDGNGYVEEGYGYDQTMRENKGCRTNTAPPGKNCMTSFNDTSNQDPDPMAEGFGLELHAIEEDDRLNNEHRDKPERHERPTRPERHKTRPPQNLRTRSIDDIPGSL